jgi:hypothetical protein
MTCFILKLSYMFQGVSARDWLESLGALFKGSKGNDSQASPWFCHGLDCPSYEVVEQFDDIELRNYEKGESCSMMCGSPRPCRDLVKLPAVPLWSHDHDAATRKALNLPDRSMNPCCVGHGAMEACNGSVSQARLGPAHRQRVPLIYPTGQACTGGELLTCCAGLWASTTINDPKYEPAVYQGFMVGGLRCCGRQTYLRATWCTT